MSIAPVVDASPWSCAHTPDKSAGVTLICRLFFSHSSLHGCYSVTVCSTESQAQREAGNVDCLSCEDQSRWKSSQECLALYLRVPRCLVPDPWKPEAAVGFSDDWTTTFWVAEQRCVFLIIMQNKWRYWHQDTGTEAELHCTPKTRAVCGLMSGHSWSLQPCKDYRLFWGFSTTYLSLRNTEFYHYLCLSNGVPQIVLPSCWERTSGSQALLRKSRA